MTDSPHSSHQEVFTAYSPVAECTTIMPDGTVLKFRGGEYSTSDEAEIKHLKDCIRGSGAILDHSVGVIKSDALVIREVGGKGNKGVPSTGTGAANSQMLANLAAASNSKG